MAREESFHDRLQAASRQLQLELSDAQAGRLLDFVDAMQRWNKTYNLTALRTPEQMLIQHVFDSLSVIPVLDRLLDKNTAYQATLVDVGSGGGLPGIILAIMRPWVVHCVDAVAKKTAFVRQMSARLDLPRLHAHHARIEALPPFNADIVLCRAFASVADFAVLAGRHAAPNGRLVAMKGQPSEAELDALRKAGQWRIEHIHELQVPELAARRCALQLVRNDAHDET